jgi:hypothetical protein
MRYLSLIAGFLLSNAGYISKKQPLSYIKLKFFPVFHLTSQQKTGMLALS